MCSSIGRWAVHPGFLSGCKSVLKDEAMCTPLRDSLVRLGGRGLRSSTFQLNLSRFSHKTHPDQLLAAPDTHKPSLQQY